VWLQVDRENEMLENMVLEREIIKAAADEGAQR